MPLQLMLGLPLQQGIEACDDLSHQAQQRLMCMQYICSVQVHLKWQYVSAAEQGANHQGTSRWADRDADHADEGVGTGKSVLFQRSVLCLLFYHTHLLPIRADDGLLGVSKGRLA